jgi:hypothetical protein
MKTRNPVAFAFRLLLAVCLLAGLAVAPASASLSTAPAYQRTGESSSPPAGVEKDAYGNPVRDEAGNRINYLPSDNGVMQVTFDTTGQVLSQQLLAKDTFTSPPLVSEASSGVSPESYSGIDTSGMLVQEWQTGIWGSGIGLSGLSVLDLDDDGQAEIVAGGGIGFGQNTFWRISSFNSSTSKYSFEWMSRDYSPTTIQRIVVGDPEQSGNYRIFVWLGNGTIEVYDAATRQLLASFSGPLSGSSSHAFSLADVDGDASIEIVMGSSSGLAVLDALTYALEWSTTDYITSELAVGNVDTDTAPEIITTSQVIDGITHVMEYTEPAGFGAHVATADIDADGMEEIIAAAAWYKITTFDADLQSPKWDIPVSLDIQALLVGDIDLDGASEIIYGDGQWGSIHVISTQTQTEEWQISNPEHGVTNVAFGDPDGDDQVELLWGAGWTSTGPDYLYIASTDTFTIEWQSTDIGGPLNALDTGDVDADGETEIVVVSYESESGYDDGNIFVYDAKTHQLEWQSPAVLGGYAMLGIHDLKLADIDQDGRLEIVLATADIYDGVILAFDGVTHNLDWTSPNSYGASFTALEINDIDQDGTMEVIAGEKREHTGATGVYVRVFNPRTNQEEWRTTDLGYWASTYDIASGDADGDGNREILFTNNGSAYLYDGSTHVREWIQSSSYFTAADIQDVDQDGTPEILLGTDMGYLIAFDGTTHAQKWSKMVSATMRHVRSFSKVNLFPTQEQYLLVTDETTLYVYKLPGLQMVWQSAILGTYLGYGNHLSYGDLDHDQKMEIVVGNKTAVIEFQTNSEKAVPILTLDKSLVKPGDLLTIELQIKNATTGVQSLSAVNPIPTHTTLEAGSLNATLGTAIVNGDQIEWALDINPWTDAFLTFQLRVDLDTPDQTLITDSITVEGQGDPATLQTNAVVDALPPVSAIQTPSPGQILFQPINPIYGSASDANGVAQVEVSINGGPWQAAEGTLAWQYLWPLPQSEGAYTIQSRAVDTVGNVETPQPAIDVRVDLLPPRIISTNPANNATGVLPDALITIQFSEPIVPSTFEFSCSRNTGILWMTIFSPDNSSVRLQRSAPFNPGEIVVCTVTHVEDQANHDLAAGDMPNPWAFMITSTVLDDHVYLPLLIR